MANLLILIRHHQQLGFANIAKNIVLRQSQCYIVDRIAPTPKWMLPRWVYALKEPPLPLADRRGILFCFFSLRKASNAIKCEPSSKGYHPVMGTSCYRKDSIIRRKHQSKHSCFVINPIIRIIKQNKWALVHHEEPFIPKTTPNVLSIIFISRSSEKFLIYSLSSFTTSSKSVISDLPDTCHIPVSPGLIARRLR